MLNRSYWQIPPGGQYPSESPRGKVAFAQTPQNPPKTPQNLKQEDQSKEARSVSAMDWEEEGAQIDLLFAFGGPVPQKSRLKHFDGGT